MYVFPLSFSFYLICHVNFFEILGAGPYSRFSIICFAPLSALVQCLRGEVVVRAANLNSSRKLGFRVFARKGSEPFRGKSGSVSFGGLTHQSVEESKLVSAPFKEDTGSLLWVLAPVALISSLVVPQFFIVSAIEDVFKNEVFAGMLYLPLVAYNTLFLRLALMTAYCF